MGLRYLLEKMQGSDGWDPMVLGEVLECYERSLSWFSLAAFDLSWRLAEQYWN